MASVFAPSLAYLPLIAVLSVSVGFGVISLSGVSGRQRLWDKTGAVFVLLGLIAFGAATAGVGT